MSGKLIIVCGMPGSGKTTLARALEEQLGGVRFSPDEWMADLVFNLWDGDARARIESLQWTLAQRLLVLRQTVIIEWGTWARSERDQLRLAARSLGAAVELRYLHASADVLFDRIQRRGMEDPPITREQVVGWVESFEAPTADELELFDRPTESCDG